MEYHGEFVDFDPLTCTPRPDQGADIPILVGGDTDVAIRARRAGSIAEGEHRTRRTTWLASLLERAMRFMHRKEARVPLPPPLRCE